MLPAAVVAVLTVNALLLGVGLAVTARLLADRGDAGDPSPADWRADAAALAGDVQELAEDRPEDLSRRFLPVSTRLHSHARAAPTGVDPAYVERVHGLGTRCRALGIEHTADRAARTGIFLEDRLAAVSVAATSIRADLPVDD